LHLRKENKKTLYYVQAGLCYCAFYLQDGQLQVADHGKAFASIRAVEESAVHHGFAHLSRCEPESVLAVNHRRRRAGEFG
jgi:hypothetical protein